MMGDGQDGVSTLVRETIGSGVERSALLLRTDRMPATLASPAQLERVRRAFEPLGLADRSRRFDLEDGRVVFSWRGEAPVLLRQSMDRLSAVLQDSPFDAPGLHQIVELFSLPAEGDRLLHAARPILAIVEDEPEIEPTGSKLQPLDLNFLDRLEQALASTDMSTFARRRDICMISPKGMVHAWEERRLEVSQLIERVAPDRDIHADPWLFRRLSRVLDRRMLSVLRKPAELERVAPFGITLNVGSILSTDFLRFDSVLPAALRGRVVVSLLPTDIASAASTFAFARNFLRARSYRIGLRAVTAPLLSVLDIPAMNVDYVQLVWSDEFHAVGKLPDIGAARWIMGRPCNPPAIEWGRNAGISLFATNATVPQTQA